MKNVDEDGTKKKKKKKDKDIVTINIADSFEVYEQYTSSRKCHIDRVIFCVFFCARVKCLSRASSTTRSSRMVISCLSTSSTNILNITFSFISFESRTFDFDNVP